jgi:putative nucleotidyltransferase with HDIG domain
MTMIDRRRPDVGSVVWAQLRLPPFPQVAIRVMQLANKENVQLHQLSELISSDPAFASEVLTVANSLLYAPRYPANSIHQAVAVMGINHLQGMCLTVGARVYMGNARALPVTQAIWRHSMASALIAEQLAKAGFMDKDLAYTSGVLHDIGRLALSTVRAKEYAELLETHAGPAASILQAERDRFGMDHCEIGQRLISDWKLPRDLGAIVSLHHASRQENGTWNMLELINVSCRMADAVGFPAFQGCEVAPFAELLDQLPPRERSQFQSDLPALTEMISKKIEAVESL